MGLLSLGSADLRTKISVSLPDEGLDRGCSVYGRRQKLKSLLIEGVKWEVRRGGRLLPAPKTRELPET